jgi:hypothetical protein
MTLEQFLEEIGIREPVEEKEIEERPPVVHGWRPSYPGEEPPF